MALLSGFNVSLSDVRSLGEAARAAFAGGAVPTSWSVVTPSALGLAGQYQDGNYFRSGSTGASAIVLKNGNDYVVSFRGTDGADDVSRYFELFTGKYIDHFKPLLTALAAQAPADANFSFTGASLGGGATNLMAKIAATAYGGRFADAKFVAFASPNIATASGILNIGFENDPVYKAVGLFKDFSSSLDNLVLATAEYMAGNTTGRSPHSMYAHTASVGFAAVNRLEQSEFYDLMKPDSVVIFDAASGLVQDITSGRSKTGAFYLGEAVGDHIAGRDGADYIEGFGGNDLLKGGKGNDSIRGGDGKDTIEGGAGADKMDGGAGDDTFVVSGADMSGDSFAGGDGVDRLRIVGSGNLTLSGFNAAASSIEVWEGNGGAVLGSSKNDVLDFTGLLSVTGLPYVDGGKGNDTLTGSGVADDLRGGLGNDTLQGWIGDDEIAGGAGKDWLTGGEGADTFVFAESGAKNVDMILDYDFAEGDMLDLSALIDASFGAASIAADFVRLTASGDDLVVQVDANGKSGGAKFADVAILSDFATPGLDQVLVYFEQQAQMLSA